MIDAETLWAEVMAEAAVAVPTDYGVLIHVENLEHGNGKQIRIATNNGRLVIVNLSPTLAEVMAKELCPGRRPPLPSAN